MMMIPKKKNMATIILSKMTKHNPMGEPYESEEVKKKEGTEDFEPGIEAAIEDLFAAMETKNVKLFASAYEDLHRMIDDKLESEESGEEENGDYSSSNEGIG